MGTDGGCGSTSRVATVFRILIDTCVIALRWEIGGMLCWRWLKKIRERIRRSRKRRRRAKGMRKWKVIPYWTRSRLISRIVNKAANACTPNQQTSTSRQPKASITESVNQKITPNSQKSPKPLLQTQTQTSSKPSTWSKWSTSQAVPPPLSAIWRKIIIKFASTFFPTSLIASLSVRSIIIRNWLRPITMILKGS